MNSTVGYNDVLLDELVYQENISVRSVNVCQYNSLFSLKEIIAYYDENSSFKNLRNCGVKSDKELVAICEKYKPLISSDKIIEALYNQTGILKIIDELSPIQKHSLNCHFEYLISKLDVRSINGLSILSEILDPNEIYNHIFSPYFSFKNLNGVGNKSQSELELFKKDLIDFIEVIQTQEQDTFNNVESSIDYKSLLETIYALTPFQKATLNRHFDYLISKLNVRSFNGLTSLSQSLNYKEISEKIFSYRFSFKTIKNIGTKSVEELEELKFELIRFINVLRTIEKDKLSREYTKLILRSTFSNLPENFEIHFENLFNGSGKIKLFTILDFLINSGSLYNENQKRTFELCYKQNLSKSKSIHSIAFDINKSSERVRQIKVKLEEDIPNSFLFVTNFIASDLADYNIDQSNLFLTINKSYATKINESENVNFNVAFYSVIFGILLSKTHKVFGDVDFDYRKRETKNKKHFENFYLISNPIFECFDFREFVEDIYIKLNERKTETYSLQFQGYIFSFLRNGKKEFFEEIYSMCEAIIFNEFDLLINLDGYIVFERSSKKQLYEYCSEALEEYSEPMGIEQIFNAIITKYPDLKIRRDSLRSSMSAEKDLFMFFGRSSIYGLRKWENEKTNIKGGTIREIAEEFLLKEDSPKHISEILDFIVLVRPDTNEKSIMQNLKLEESNKFCFYKGEFVGLKSKKYSDEINGFKKLIGGHFQINVFEKMNGLSIEEIIKHYVTSYGYKEVQIKSVIRNKISLGVLKFSQDNKLMI